MNSAYISLVHDQSCTSQWHIYCQRWHSYWEAMLYLDKSLFSIRTMHRRTELWCQCMFIYRIIHSSQAHEVQCRELAMMSRCPDWFICAATFSRVFDETQKLVTPRLLYIGDMDKSSGYGGKRDCWSSRLGFLS